MDRQQVASHRRDGGGNDGDAAEWKQVAELRAVAEAQDPACKEEDELTLRRFLRARDHNIGKASAMLVKYVKWKREAKPNGFIAEEEVANELAQDKLYMQGLDKLGRPIIYAFPARHDPKKRDLDELKRYVTYVLDKTVSRHNLWQAAGRSGEVCGGGGSEGVGLLQLRHQGLPGSAGDHAELLPGEAGPGAPDPCALRVHGGMEDHLPLHRRQHQEEVRVCVRQGAGQDAPGGHRRDPAAGDVRRQDEAGLGSQPTIEPVNASRKIYPVPELSWTVRTCYT